MALGKPPRIKPSQKQTPILRPMTAKLSLRTLPIRNVSGGASAVAATIVPSGKPNYIDN